MSPRSTRPRAWQKRKEQNQDEKQMIWHIIMIANLWHFVNGGARFCFRVKTNNSFNRKSQFKETTRSHTSCSKSPKISVFLVTSNDDDAGSDNNDGDEDDNDDDDDDGDAKGFQPPNHGGQR